MNSRPLSECHVLHVGHVVSVFRPNIPVVFKDMYLKKTSGITEYTQCISHKDSCFCMHNGICV